MAAMFEFAGALDGAQFAAVATGHVAPVMGWVETPNGRRPSDVPETDDAGAPFQVADVLLPLGRDGKPELFGVRFASHEVPKLDPYSAVELVGLRVKVRASRQGKGVDVTLAADAVRPASSQRQGRRSSEGEAA